MASHCLPVSQKRTRRCAATKRIGGLPESVLRLVVLERAERHRAVACFEPSHGEGKSHQRRIVLSSPLGINLCEPRKPPLLVASREPGFKQRQQTHSVC